MILIITTCSKTIYNCSNSSGFLFKRFKKESNNLKEVLVSDSEKLTYSKNEHGNSVFSAQFFCETKGALENKVY